MFMFAVAAMDGVADHFRANPLLVLELTALAFALGSYRFTRYRKADASDVRLVPPDGVDAAEIAGIAEAAMLAGLQRVIQARLVCEPAAFLVGVLRRTPATCELHAVVL